MRFVTDEKSKQEYIKTLNSTNSNYEEQLKKINEAIEVLPTLLLFLL